MTGVFVPRLSILPVAQRSLWPLLQAVTGQDFLLYGGTAIALRLGHRVSVDFDFFTRGDFDPLILRQRFGFLERASTLQAEPRTLTVSLPIERGAGVVKLSFFGGIGSLTRIALR